MEEGYQPPEDFKEDALKPLINLDLTGSNELWLIQCPNNQVPEIDGLELKVKLQGDGMLGSIQGSSGKGFDLVSFASQEVDASVILPSGAESKIVGKISRRVSLVRYPEPNELIKVMGSQPHQKLTGVLKSSSNQFSTPSQSSRHRSTHSASTHSKRQRPALSSYSKDPQASKRKQSESTRWSDHSGSSARHRSPTITGSGSSDRSKKSKKEMKTQD